ncbi:MAG: hypothetical protein RL238_2324 [Actinomycetota bacterium]|jgi:hypothetical protein
MRHSIAAAVVAGTLALSGCGGDGDTSADASSTTVERDRNVRDDDITRSTADVAVGCVKAMADLMHFDVSWITSSTPPATVAPVDPELLDQARGVCDDAQAAVAADLDPIAGKGWTLMLAEQLQHIIDVLEAPEVDLSGRNGVVLAMLNISGMVDGSFFQGRPGLVIT